MNYDEIENRQRIVRLEQQVQFLLRELGLEGKAQALLNEPSADDDVRELIRRGRMIEAIKLYREKTGLGLREAKEIVERMRDGYL